MPSPADRKYSATHEWHKMDGDTLTLGLTQFAVDQLTDVTYVEMRKIGTKFNAGESVGEVESVKTTSDIYAGVSGEIVELNKAVVDDPSLLNRDPMGAGWLIKAKVSDASGAAKLLDAAAYDKQHG